MNVSEANALNRLLHHLLGVAAVPDADAREAALLLVGRASTALKAGLTPKEVGALWDQRPAAGMPRRGDAVAGWLRETRELYDEGSAAWQAIDDLLADYRAHADYGLPLDALVPEPPHGGEQP